jgi:DivIVA domain-containing protein
VETAEATPACVVCGAPPPEQSAATAWSGSRAWVKRYSVRQRRLWVKPDQAAGPKAPAGPGGTGASTAGPADIGVAGPAGSDAIHSEADGATLAEWVEARKFSTTRLRPGYAEDEVDAFRNAIRDTFLGLREPSLTPDEIRDKQFTTTRLRPGYEEEEVDAFLDEAELRLAALARGRERSGAADPAAGAVQVRCLECGTDGAEATEVCARCGAPTGYQPSAADPAVTSRAGRSGPSRRLMITVGVATLVLGAGLLAGLAYSGTWTSSNSSTDWLTVYQLQTGECLQTWGETLGSFNDGNGPFTAVPCHQPHTAEVFFAGNAWPQSLAYPGDQAIYNDGYVRCDTAFSAYDGIDSWLSAFTVVPSTPDSSTWPGGDRWLVCLATEYGSVDYSIRGSRQ